MTTKTKPRAVRMRLKESFFREGGGLFGTSRRKPTRRQAESYAALKKRLGGKLTPEPEQKRSILDVEPEATGGDYSAMKQANDGKLTAD